MRAIGVFLIFLAGLCLFGALNMDTSVPTDTGTRVHNIGLLRHQENAILIAVGLFIGGIILVAIGGKKSVESNEAGEIKKCPYCAETIKRSAIVCRFCGKDIPSETIGEFKSGSTVAMAVNSIADDEKIRSLIATLIGLGYQVSSPRPNSWDVVGLSDGKYFVESVDDLGRLTAKLKQKTEPTAPSESEALAEKIQGLVQRGYKFDQVGQNLWKITYPSGQEAEQSEAEMVRLIDYLTSTVL